MARSKKAPKERKAKPAKAPKASRASAAVAVEEIEEVKSGGWGIDEGIVLTTTLALIAACYLAWQAAKDAGWQ